MHLKTISGWLCLALLAGAQTRGPERAVRQAARGTRGAVAAGTDAATEAGMRMYHRGGNAVDAGVAAMLAASVVEYSHFGFGGEAPILIRTKDGKVFAIAGVGTMPKLATAQFFRERKLMPGEVQETDPNGLSGMVPVAGLMPALVPGMVDAALVALKTFGTMTFAEVVQPALELADSSAVDETRAGAIMRARKFMEMWPSTKAVYMPNGKAPRPGEILHQTELARTLRLMVDAEKKGGIEAVRDVFYRGDIARRIDAFSKASGGLLRYEDMAAFHLEAEEPVSATYRGYTVYKPGFWSQGPAMLEALNILEGLDLKSMGFNSPEYIHTVTEALKLAYADRDTYYGDPKFAPTPTALLSKEYSEQRRALIAPKASMEFRPGAVNGKTGRHPSQSEIARIRIDDALMARDTTCVDAIDKDGIVFSATPSGAWLPSVIAGDTGIPLTARGQSFLLVPGHPNELAGGKRPRVTLSPTLVTKDGKPYVALSTPGGDNQDQSLLQVLLDALEFGMNAQNAVEAPRFQTRHLVSSFDNHAMSPGDLLLDERIAPGVREALAGKGHHIETRPRFASGAAPVMIRVTEFGVIEAGADPYGYRSARAW
jgi:gamma-glutamyltranspeptidase / glutathione hydrolase